MLAFEERCYCNREPASFEAKCVAVGRVGSRFRQSRREHEAVLAVSAVLMADRLYNEFDIEAGVGAATDWVVTFPTKHFYVDPGIVDTDVPPFELLFDETSCHAIAPDLFDREGFDPNAGFGYGLPPVTGGTYLCYEVDVVPIAKHADGPSKALGSRISTGPFIVCGVELVYPPAGQLAMGFPDEQQQMRPATSGAVFHGLPAMGFAAINYINANVTPGVLSNYSAAYPHRSHASCTNSTNPQSACP
jgi:hypothetical protein